MNVVTRFGLAILRPRWALAIGGDRRAAGRSGSDLMLALLAFLLATHLRFLVECVWVLATVDPGLGLRMLLGTLTGGLTVPLGFLVVAAAILWSLGGGRRDLGRAFDLACVAVLPMLAIDLSGRGLAFAFHLVVPRIAVVVLTGISFAWAGILVVFAAMTRSAGPVAIPAPPAPDALAGRRAGVVLGAIVTIGLIGQVVWLAQHPDAMRPIQNGDVAPLFALPRVTPDGSLGSPVALSGYLGRPVVVDFWATWCGPCLASMPKLDAFAKQHPEVAVLAINTDDAHEARAVFDERHWTLDLLADVDGTAGRDYRVETIPHTVVIDAAGKVRRVLHGGAHDLAKIVEEIRK